MPLDDCNLKDIATIAKFMGISVDKPGEAEDFLAKGLRPLEERGLLSVTVEVNQLLLKLPVSHGKRTGAMKLPRTK